GIPSGRSCRVPPLAAWCSTSRLECGSWLMLGRSYFLPLPLRVSAPPVADAQPKSRVGRDEGGLIPFGPQAGPHRKHGGGRNHRPGAISDRKAGIALNDLLAQHRPLARFPERCRVDDPVAKRTAIGTIAARDRAWNADELGPHFIAGEPHRR